MLSVSTKVAAILLVGATVSLTWQFAAGQDGSINRPLRVGPAPVASDPTVKWDYDIVYVRAPRTAKGKNGKDRLAMVWREDPAQNLREGRSALDQVAEWRVERRSFADLATSDAVSATLSGDDGAEQIVGGSISPNLLSVLGVQPMLGRGLSTEEASRNNQSS